MENPSNYVSAFACLGKTSFILSSKLLVVYIRDSRSGRSLSSYTLSKEDLSFAIPQLLNMAGS